MRYGPMGAAVGEIQGQGVQGDVTVPVDCESVETTESTGRSLSRLVCCLSVLHAVCGDNRIHKPLSLTTTRLLSVRTACCLWRQQSPQAALSHNDSSVACPYCMLSVETTVSTSRSLSQRLVCCLSVLHAVCGDNRIHKPLSLTTTRLLYVRTACCLRRCTR